MRKIPLRAYHLEIEQLIDNERSQEALEHCQRIISIYPRCLETFRLMGKAYLELHQYDKAEDAFKKVLSSVPDDFIANIGMSLLREKQTNLEGTIWHMERANEAQQSNAAVQSELRRLYRQRDGRDSTRTLLTRGALVRMYIRGDMISNALAEIQAILAEDPSRMDIKILHAVACFKAGKTDEAIQICRQILSEYPYCFEANRLLYENRSPSIKIEEMQTFQQHLRELDPYYEFTSSNQPDAAKVPEENVKIEVPDDLGPKTATENETPNEVFSPFGSVEATNGAFGKQQAQSESAFKSEENLPSWMEEWQKPSFQSLNEGMDTGIKAGQTPATPNFGNGSGKPMTTEDTSSKFPSPDEKPNSPFPLPEDKGGNPNPFIPVPGQSIPAAEPGDIPEWLKALASEPPAASSDAVTAPLRVPGETGVLQTGEENLDFLRNIPGESPTPKPPEPKFETPVPGPIESLPGILPPSPFLSSSESTQPVPVEGSTSEAPKPVEREMPDWLRSAVEPSAESASVSDLRQDFIPENLPPIEPSKVSQSFESQFQIPEPEDGITAPVHDEEVPTPEIEQYLEQLRKDITPSDQPDWLKRENLGSDLEALFEETKKPATPEPKPEPESEQPDWMLKLKQEEAGDLSKSAAPEPSQPLPSNVPDWLFASEETDGATAPIQSETPITHQPPPDWLAAARPDIFSRDYILDSDQESETEKAAPAESETTSSGFDFSSFLQETPPETPAKETPAAEPAAPDLSFLQSQPVDFMKADREPLEDNLAASEQVETGSGLDFTKAEPAENLPADLAALLREEAMQDITTSPLEGEQVETSPAPGLSFDLNIPELSEDKSAVETGVGETALPEMEVPSSVTPIAAEPAIETTSEIAAPEVPTTIEQEKPLAEEPVVPIEKAPASFEVPTIPASSINLKAVEEAPVPLMEETSPIQEESVPSIEIFRDEAQPTQPEVAPQFANGFEAEDQTNVLETEQTPEEITPTHEILVMPGHKLEPDIPSPVKEEEPAVVVEPAKPMEEKPAPAEFVKPVEISAPVEVAPQAEKTIPVEPEIPASPEPVYETAKVVQKPAEPKQVAPRKVVKPPSTPRPVYRVEKKPATPVYTTPTAPRKGSGAADLTRAREAVTHGDLATALRRYIKLINSNKALDAVSADLKEITRKNPKNFLAWQTYGDARLRSNRIQEALDAYAKAADLLK